MAKTFTTTTTATDTLKADAKGHAEAVFTVTNTTGRPVRGMARAKALGNTQKEWLSVSGETERDFGGGSTEQFTLNFDAAGAPAGKYPFRLDVASAVNPDEDFTEGPTVNVEMASVAPAVEPKKGFPKWIFFVIGGVVLLAIIGVVIWLVVPHGEKKYVLPDVANVEENDAKQRLQSGCEKGSGCVVVSVNPVADNTVAKGSAIRTEPAAGAEVAAGSSVTLFTSTGPEGPPPAAPYKLPAVASQAEDAAKAALESGCEDQKACVSVEINRMADNQVPKGKVIRIEPNEGTEVPVGSQVVMFVSRGPEKVTILNVVNQPADKATDTLEKSCSPAPCLNVEINRIADSRVVAGRVIRTEPAAGTQVDAGSKVAVFVSGGTDEVTIPTVRLKLAADARRTLENACRPTPCLKVSVISQNDIAVAAGRAIGTNPSRGALKIGSAIVLILSTGPPLRDVGKYVGLSEAVAKQRIVKDGFMVGTVKRNPMPFLPSKVTAQDPAAGSKKPKGTRINLTVIGK
jgi:beta-lactam-binding protein with PASTA domain